MDIKKPTKDISQLQYIKGIGPARAAAFAEEGILSPEDLIFYFPRDYIDRNAVSSLKALSVKLSQEVMFPSNLKSSQIPLKSEVTIVAAISGIHEHKYGKNRKMLIFNIADGSGGRAEIIFWNYVSYYLNAYTEGEMLVISGKPEIDSFGKIKFHHPEIEKFDPDDEKLYRSGGILPIYRMTQSLRSARFTMKQLRYAIRNVLDNYSPTIDETLSQNIIKKYKFPDIRSSVSTLHFPQSEIDLKPARERMKFEEIFFFELTLAIRQRGIKFNEKGLALNPKSPRARKLYESLPFKLTGDQKKVIREISADMESGKPMNRLLQGDVGSGKTIVAVLSMLQAIDNGYQTAFMAPTELLAEQHYHTLMNYMKDLDVEVVQLVGGQKTKVRREVLEKISTGEANLIVGTHALFENEIEYNKLGLVIIDEQHRFGVAQRAELKKLAQKSHGEFNLSPHILVMSATPIPRTLSLTVYGDLDVSIIREMPANRKPIKTKVMFESQLDMAYDFISKQIKRGHQAYVVYPLVEKSEKLELKAATEHYERLRSEIFPEFSCGLIHGQMFWYEKEDAMKAFLSKEFQILVATTVIEVGIDVANATVMLIENAERFGLSQLHQLRGRVGRGAEQSYCMLITKDNFKYQLNKRKTDGEEPNAAVIRLKTMEETTDGFKIAETDLKLRGPGDVMGTRQSGLPDFKYIDLVNDGEIITKARREAFSIIERDPHLRMLENAIIRKALPKKFGEGNFFDVA